MADSNTIHLELSNIPAQCVAYNFQKTARVITSFYRRTIAPSGLKGNQFPLLLAIKLSQPISITELAKTLDLDRTTLSRNLKILEKNSYVSLEQSNDHRIRNVQLSGEGEVILNLALPLWQQAQNTIVEKIGKDQWSNLLSSFHDLASIVK
ncbi:transcriptional regulator [Desulfocapsa sulfexigens DSM 10523]|uniref:Transcriptional regulator n=1 Tax=Desulfocapsa sulfexigens (strain DSM 10523 / SB164P1) TaxID=1167006 RepID=M1P830_DESSD|nr:MarR family winged helix-turn-helix transcriptional regulator [Desulfocapsa sulfexigens]AGF77837.1 transcriptional regulator [Desulfocapsa sulfexigens DSM 10523]